jgi:type I restriction enzyme S subunit
VGVEEMIGSILQNSLVSGLSAYPNYKGTNIEWIGKIPAHWQLKKLKYISKVDISNVDKNKQENELPVKLCNYIDVYYHDYITEDLDLMEATASPEELIKWALKKGHVIVTKDSESWDDIAVPAFVPFDLDGVICGYHLALIEPEKSQIDGKYLFYSFNSSAINHQYQVSANGITRYGLGKYWLDNSIIVIPPISEQTSIVAFLSQVTTKIDSLIAKKRHLIELLEEKRTALIGQVVTKGMSPRAAMKDSGVEWLGEIPAHWELRRNSYIFRERDKRGFPDLPLLNVSIHSGVTIREFSNEHIEQMASDWNIYKLAKKGDLVFNKMRMWQGAVGVAPQDGLVSPDYIVAEPLPNVDARYYELLFRLDGYKTEINRFSHGIVPDRNRLYWDQFKQMYSLYPPYWEQTEMLNYISNVTNKIDELLESINEEISKLIEYRAALISAAVTGKIKICE